jgi:cold shock CspA family protein
MRGKMLWFNETKDFGFISTDEGERLYVPGSGFAEGEKPHGRCAGLLVEFRVRTDGQRQAEQVTFVPEVVPRRARLRHGSRVGG